MGTKDSSKTQELLLQQDILDLIASPLDVRSNLTVILKKMNRMLGADRCIVAEFAPSLIDHERLMYARLLEVSALAAPREIDLSIRPPDHSFSNAMVLDVLKALAKMQVDTADDACSGVEGLLITEASHPSAFEFLKGHDLIHYLVRHGKFDFVAAMILPITHDGNCVAIIGFPLMSTEKLTPSLRVFLDQLGKQMGAAFDTYFKQSLALVTEFFPNIWQDENRGQLISIEAPGEEPVSFANYLASKIDATTILIDFEVGGVKYINRKSILGHDISKFHRPVWAYFSLIHPDDQLEAIANFFHKLTELSDGEPLETSYRLMSNSGHWHWVSKKAYVYERYPDGRVKSYLMVVQDINDEVLYKQEFEEQQKHYHNFLDYSKEGIYYVNCGIPVDINASLDMQEQSYYANAYIQDCNRITAQIHGFDTGEALIGNTIKAMHDMHAKTGNLHTRFFREFAECNYRIKIERKYKLPGRAPQYYINEAIGIINDGALIGIWGIQREITDSYLAKKALFETEIRLESIVNDAQLGIYDWDLEKELIHINGIAARLLGVSEANKHVLSTNEFIHLLAEESVDELRESTTFHLRSKSDNYTAEVLVSHEQCPERWLQLHGKVVKRSSSGYPRRISGTFIDIHDRKLDELKIQQGQVLLESVMNAIPDIKLRVNTEGEVLAVYGMPLDAAADSSTLPLLKGKKLADVFAPTVVGGLLHNIQQAVATNQLQAFEFPHYLSATGEAEFFEVRIKRLNISEVLVVLRNITQTRRVTQSLHEQFKKVEEQNRQLLKLSTSNTLLENFALIASHDMKEPLRTIRSFGGLLQQRANKQLDEVSNEYLDFIVDGAKRMNNLVEGLLSYSRLTTNVEREEREAIALRPLLNSIAKELNTQLNAESGTLVIGEIPEAIFGNRLKIYQLFQNLIVNGIKFHRKDTAPIVTIDGEELPGYWKFSVNDNGIGIEEAYHLQIFELFKKLHAQGKYKGTGIGLAIVRLIVRQHGGDIWLTSTLGQGTTFIFTIAK